MQNHKECKNISKFASFGHSRLCSTISTILNYLRIFRLFSTIPTIHIRETRTPHNTHRYSTLECTRDSHTTQHTPISRAYMCKHIHTRDSHTHTHHSTCMEKHWKSRALRQGPVFGRSEVCGVLGVCGVLVHRDCAEIGDSQVLCSISKTRQSMATLASSAL